MVHSKIRKTKEEKQESLKQDMMAKLAICWRKLEIEYMNADGLITSEMVAVIKNAILAEYTFFPMLEWVKANKVDPEKAMLEAASELEL